MRIKASAEDSGKRIDIFVSKQSGLSRSRVQDLIESGFVLVAGKVVKPNYRIKAGEEISFSVPEPKTPTLIAEPIALNILYRDSHIVVVDKPPSLVVYPAAGHYSGTLLNALLYHLGPINAPGGPLRPGIVHRLDKDTSGVMVVALTDDAYYSLVEQFRKRTVLKKYIALVWGVLREESGTITSAIGRARTDRKKMSTRTAHPKEAKTIWKTIERFSNATLIEIKLETGRTHQIRVHMASLGHPVLGDRVYGKKTKLDDLHFQRQMLHASLLGFVHPVTGRYMVFESPMPDDMRTALLRLRQS